MRRRFSVARIHLVVNRLLLQYKVAWTIEEFENLVCWTHISNSWFNIIFELK